MKRNTGEIVCLKVVELRTETLNIAPYRPSYAVLFDFTPAQVAAFVAAHPQRFVFPFVTKPVEESASWNGLPRSDYLLRPIYIGNFRAEDHDSIACQTVAHALGLDLDSM